MVEAGKERGRVQWSRRSGSSERSWMGGPSGGRRVPLDGRRAWRSGY